MSDKEFLILDQVYRIRDIGSGIWNCILGLGKLDFYLRNIWNYGCWKWVQGYESRDI